MRVLEVVAVLESVTEHPVEADMGQPDQPERDDQGVALPPADPDQRGRRRRAVPEVVGPRPETWSAEIAEHRDVGQQQQERHEPPGLPDSRIRDRGTNDEGRAFETEQAARHPDHRALFGEDGRHQTTGTGGASTSGVGAEIRRAVPSQPGIHQFALPKSFISAGTSKARITVASKMIPPASPIASDLTS